MQYISGRGGGLYQCEEYEKGEAGGGKACHETGRAKPMAVWGVYRGAAAYNDARNMEDHPPVIATGSHRREDYQSTSLPGRGRRRRATRREGQSPWRREGYI